MTYPYNNKGRANQTEVLVFDQTVDNTTAASGLKAYTVDFPAGAYDIGLALSTSGAGAAATLKAYAYQTPEQDAGAAALSGALAVMPPGASASVTVLTASSTSTYGGTCGQLTAGTTCTMPVCVYPYGLRVTVTCNTNSGDSTHKVIIAQRT